MKSITDILKLIKDSVSMTSPSSELILYGSYARGDESKDSDIDVLILVNEEKITRDVEKKIKYPLYDIEFDNGIIISPLVVSKSEWEIKHRMTPLYDNIAREGKML